MWPHREGIMIARLAVRLAAILACTVGIFAPRAQAQTAYPEKTVRLVVSFPAGGATDIIARLIAERMSNDWHKPVVVENISGAAGATGTAQAAKSPPDGYTLLMGTGTTTTLLPHLRPNLPYSPMRDLSAVTLICSFPNMLVVRPGVPAHTVQELIDLVRANPGKYSYASSGYGASPHLSAEWFKLITKTDILHVPFTGSAPAQPALLGGHVDMMFDTMPTVWPLVQEGKLRALGVTTAQRVPFAPDVPAIAETLPDYDVTSWLGIMVPAGTPADIKAKIAAPILAFIQDQAMVQKLVTLGAVAAKPNTPEDFTATLKRDYDKWGRVIRDTGIKLNN
jgi:tripartite-type tricarboxylate transporter receptor subunit TctC